jgi:hypothetical protein
MSRMSRVSWLRNPYARPLPALFVLAVVLSLSLLFAGEPSNEETRRQGLRDLACAIGVGGAICYWGTLLLGRAGLLHYGGSFAMKEPTPAELAVAELLLRGLGLLMAYLGPLLFFWI